MKNFKLLFYSLLISLAMLTSCTNNDVDDLPDPQESETLQTSLDNLRSLFNEDGTVINDLNPTGNLLFDFCFEFVYPIELIYNNEATVTINSNEELIEVLINSTGDLYIVGIEFPFNVEIYNPNTNEVEILTITNESEFAELLLSCVFDDPCDCDDEFEPVCVEIEDGGVIITIMFPNECYALCEGFTPNDFVDCEIIDPCECDITIYDPVCVQVDGLIIEFPNVCIAECEGFTEDDFIDCEIIDPCECDNEYEPVCVQIGDLIIEFQNACFAECEGFTEDDFVDCEVSSDCSISELEVEVGECNPAGTYSLTINFEYENADGQEFFDLFVRNNEFIGYFALADLPLTIENFELSDYDYDYIKVCLNDTDCCEEIEWEAPDCNGDGVDCYEFIFPITMFQGGESVEVDSNEEVDEYLDSGWDLWYPIDIIVDNDIMTVNQGILEGAYGERCD